MSRKKELSSSQLALLGDIGVKFRNAVMQWFDFCVDITTRGVTSGEDRIFSEFPTLLISLTGGQFERTSVRLFYDVHPLFPRQPSVTVALLTPNFKFDMNDKYCYSYDEYSANHYPEVVSYATFDDDVVREVSATFAQNLLFDYLLSVYKQMPNKRFNKVLSELSSSIETCLTDYSSPTIVL